MTTTAAKRPPLARKVTPKSEAARAAELDKGIAFSDPADGARLTVRIGDVKGVHDAALRAAVGLDFVGLMAALEKSQGLDLMAAVVWFGRLVNGLGEPQSYADLLQEFGYSDVIDMDVDEAADGDGDPEA